MTGKRGAISCLLFGTQPSAVCHCRTLACLPAQYAVRAQKRGGEFQQCIFHESCRRHVRPLPASLSCTQTTIPFLLPPSLSNYYQAINMPTSLALSAIAGWVSVSSWVVVYSPQIIENFQLQSGEGLSVAFIVRQSLLSSSLHTDGPSPDASMIYYFSLARGRPHQPRRRRPYRPHSVSPSFLLTRPRVDLPLTSTDLNRPFADPSYSSPSGTPFATSSSSSKCITTAVWPPRPAPRRLPS